MSPVLRPATPLDAPACTAILQEWAAETPWFPNHPRALGIDEFIAGKIADGGMTIAEENGKPAGFLAREDDYVSCLYVGRAMRGGGVGKALLDGAKAGRRCLSLWTFQANLGARRFYLREGFSEAQRTDGADNEEGLPDIEFTWHCAEEA